MQSRAHFRILGIPIRIEPLFVIVAFIFGIQRQQFWLILVFVLLVFISVLFHELGHALTYRMVGQRSAIVLHGFGGFTVPTGGGRRVLSKGKSIAVSLSGAVFQLLLLWLPARYLLNAEWSQELLGVVQTSGGLAIVGWDDSSNWDFHWGVVLYWAAFINLWWALFNLLPIRPLDGGHVAETVLGFENACKVSIVAAIVAALWALRGGWFFMALLMGFFAFTSYRDLKEGQNTGMLDVEAPEAPPGGSGGGGGPGGGARPQRGSGRSGRRRGRGRGSQHLQPVPNLDLGFLGRDAAEVEAAAWNQLRDGDSDRAAGLLRQAGGSSANPFLQASVALAQGHAGIAIDLFEAAYTKEPDGPPNLVPAMLLADRGQAVALTRTLLGNGSNGISAAGSLQTHLHYADRFATAAQVGELVFAAGPASPAQTAFEVACAWSRAGSGEEALRWVEAAIDAGFKAPAILDGEPDLAEARNRPGWPSVRAKLG